MLKRLKNWFIPSGSNGFEPHILRIWPVAIMGLVAVLFFGSVQLIEHQLVSSESFLAAVVSSVLIDLTNFDRAGEDLNSLSFNPTLKDAAQLKAQDMANKGYFSHNSPDGKTPWYWLNEVDYQFVFAGENLAVFFGDSEDVERAWMNSPSHRANILNSNFTEIGIATAEGYYEGRKTVFVVQMFGTPSILPPIATIGSRLIVEELENVPDVPDVPDVQGGEVVGDSLVIITEEDVDPLVNFETIYQDETFVAVKSDMVEVPSVEVPSNQSSALERLIASPQTLLSYTYGALGGLVSLALILLVFLELKVQKPRNIIMAIFLLLVIWILFSLANSEVIVASVNLIQ